MKKAKILLFALLLVVFIVSCENKETSGIETKNHTREVPEIEALTSAEKIKVLLNSKTFSEENPITTGNLKLIESFYSERNYEPAWTKQKLREGLFRSISKAPEEGLFFEDYHGQYLEESLSNLSDLNEDEKNNLEILLTANFLKYANHLSSGKLEPKQLYKIWDIESNKPNLINKLKEAISEENVEEIIEALAPTHIIYSGLKKSLEEHRQLLGEEKEIITIEKGKNIKIGDTSSRLRLITKRLEQLEYLEDYKKDSTNVYHEDLQKVIEVFQKDYGIETDGEIGAKTIEALNLTAEDRYNKILVNLERWRWYPRDLGDHYFIVNIPGFTLNVVENEDTIANHRVMVGTEARKTPVFSDEIEHIVYNPTWTIPPTIKNNDVIPAAKRDNSYLHKKNISVFDSSGKKLVPSEIKWDENSKKYTYRQESGSTNPLGQVKIIYPNKHLIYLHDTPSQELFKKDTRAQSSGCVRVEDVLELAEYLIDDQEKYNKKKIDEILISGKTTTIKVNKKVKVHHFYWTAWREENKIQFADDIYKLDNEILQKLNQLN